MNVQLSRKVKAAAKRARMNYREIAEAAGVEYGWVRQVAAGGIAKPNADWLRAMAEAVDADANEWLALTNQLGAAAAGTGKDDTPTPVPATYLERIDDLVAELQAERRVIQQLLARIPLPLDPVFQETADEAEIAAAVDTGSLLRSLDRSDAAEGPRTVLPETTSAAIGRSEEPLT